MLTLKLFHYISFHLQAQLKQAADEAKERENAAAEQRCRQLENLKQKSRHDQESNTRFSIWGEG